MKKSGLDGFCTWKTDAIRGWEIPLVLKTTLWEVERVDLNALELLELARRDGVKRFHPGSGGWRQDFGFASAGGGVAGFGRSGVPASMANFHEPSG